MYWRRISAGQQLTLDPRGTDAPCTPADVLVLKPDLPSPFAPEGAPHERTIYSAVKTTVDGGRANGAPLPGEDDPSIELGTSPARVAWSIYVGVSGSYRLTIPYRTAVQEQFGTIRILDAGGNKVDAAPVRIANEPGKSKHALNITVTLNAGNYTVELRVPNPDELAIGALTVQ